MEALLLPEVWKMRPRWIQKFFRARETVYHQDIDQIDTWLKMLNHLAHANPDSEPTVALRDRRLLSWQGQYAFVGITVLESGVASHGMNEKVW